MNREEIIEDFFRTLKICLNASSLYNKDHPYFIKAVNEFKEKSDSTLQSLGRITISIAPDYLLIDGEKFAKSGLFDEIASFFHQRKIKNIEIKNGITSDEMILFISAISMRPKEIIKSGGVNKLLSSNKSPYILVEELDYTQLLTSGGEAAKDVWLYLLKEAVEGKDNKKFDKVTEHCDVAFSSLKMQDFVDDGNLGKNIQEFMGYLKANKKDDFVKCSKEVVKIILKEKGNASKEEVSKIKPVIDGMDSQNLSDALVDEISNDANFDALNFKLFSLFVDENKSKAIASTFVDKVNSSEPLKNDAKFKKKVKDLFTSVDNSAVSSVFRNSLSSIMENISFKGENLLDHVSMQANYETILLNMLNEEKNLKKIEGIVLRINNQWKNIVEFKKIDFIKDLLSVLKEKSANPDFALVLKPLYKEANLLIENMLFSSNAPTTELDQLFEGLKEKTSEKEYYLDKIFVENLTGCYALKILFNFFPLITSEFVDRLLLKSSDLEFVDKLIASIKNIDVSRRLDLYKRIFNSSSEMIKLEILHALRYEKEQDFDFLFEAITKGDSFIKKEALVLIKNDAATLEKVANMLLFMPSPWGTKNRLILENMSMIKELDLKEFKDFIILLSKKKFFWNSNIRKKADEILGGWND